jgi:hypothetical protein
MTKRFKKLATGAALAILSAGLAATTATASADTVSLYLNGNSDYISQLKGYGGEFTAVTGNYSTSSVATTTTNLEKLGYTANTITGPSTTYGNTEEGFDTFCLQESTYFKPGTQYYYTESASLPPALTVGVAWLYYEFATGKLSSFAYTGGNAATDAAELQDAIWYLQGETPYNQYYGNGTITSDPYLILAENEFSNSLTKAEAADSLGGYGVEVMNLNTQSNGLGTAIQDQLILTGTPPNNGGGTPVPDGGITLCLLGSAFGGLAFLRRKFFA